MPLSFSTVCSLNNFIKPFHEISSNNSSEAQYDLQYISIEKTNEIKKEIVRKLGRKRKAVNNKSFNMTRGESETGKKISIKRKNDNQIYYQQNKKIILDALLQYYEDYCDLIKSKSGKYRVENKDVIQTRKSQHYAQSRHKICEKQRNYYDEMQIL